MLRKGGIALRLILVFTLSSTLIFTVILAYNYYRSSLILEQQLKSNARNLGLSLSRYVEKKIFGVIKVTEGLVLALESCNYSELELLALIHKTVKDNPETYGIDVAFEPYAFKPDIRLYDHYFYWQNGKVSYLGPDQSYDYQLKNWYRIARDSKTPSWSEPYQDDGGVSTLMTTYSVPFYLGKDDARKFAGIVATDITLDDLTELISSVKILDTGYASIISHEGTIIAHPDPNLIFKKNLFRLAEDQGDDILRKLVQRMTQGETDFVQYTNLTGGKSWIYFAPLGTTGWSLAVTFPDAEMYAKLNNLSITMVTMGLTGVLLLTVAVILISHSITKPLRTLAAASDQMAEGNFFDLELPTVRSNDEVGQLTQAFATMNISLQQYIRDLTEATASKERIQSELKVATDIQASLLPRVFPPFPDRSDFTVYANMDPAKEVGGDFYDFFFVDDDNLCFLIADVADKGVPAALYMMVAKTLLKTEAQRLGTPDEILSRVNEILAVDNENCMFVTVFCAILDTRSGEVRFANAGHNPPLFTNSDKGYSYLPIKAGFVLGPMPGSEYVTESIVMKPGDVLFLYTDGVTEAKNRAAELFGEERLLDILQQNRSAEVSQLIHAVRAEVERHADGADQSDDVTMLALSYQGQATGTDGPREGLA